jgi:hypothetical protein
VARREPGEVDLKSPERCLEELESIVDRVERGALPQRTAQTMISAVKAAADIMELAIVAKRLALLEKKAGL